MIYLIRSGEFLKVGYSSNVSKRLQAYMTHNPLAELLYTFDGDMDLEKRIHKCLSDVKHSTEWFYWSDNIIDRIRSEVEGVLPKEEFIDTSYFTVVDNSFIYKIERLSDIKMFFSIVSLSDYNSGRIFLDKKSKKELCEHSGVDYSNLTKSINRLTELNLIKKDGSHSYWVYINPTVVIKGSVKNIESLNARYVIIGKIYTQDEILK